MVHTDGPQEPGLVGRYLRRRGGIFYFRVRVPEGLRKAAGRREISVSLKTSRFDVAVAGARSMRTGLDRIMTATSHGLAYAEVEGRVRAWIASAALDHDAGAALNDSASGLFTAAEMSAMGHGVRGEMDVLMAFMAMTERAALRTEAARAASGLGSSADLNAIVATAASDLGIGLAAGTPEAAFLRRAVMRNVSTLFDAADATATGRPLPAGLLTWQTVSPGVEPSVVEALPNADVAMSALWELFCEAKVAKKEWKAAEGVSSHSTLKLWLQSEGEHAIGRYSSSNAENFLKNLRKLPSNYFHNKKLGRIFAESGLKGVIQSSSDDVAETVSDKTINKHLGRLHEFWKWSASSGKVLRSKTASIFEGMFIHIPKDKLSRHQQDEARRVFEDIEIRTMFSSPVFLGCRSMRKWKERGTLVWRDHRYWLPLIGMLHGMRREEPLILKVKHLKQKSGIWYFDLKSKDIMPLLKDCGSPREIPLHRDILALGFIEARVLGRNPNDLLFPEAKSNSVINRNGDPFGKWFTNFRRHCGLGDPELDFHATRHTVINRLLDAAVPPSHVEEISGHESTARRSEMSTYDHGRRIELLKHAIDRLELPIDVERLRTASSASDTVHGPYVIDASVVPRRRQARSPARPVPTPSKRPVKARKAPGRLEADRRAGAPRRDGVAAGPQRRDPSGSRSAVRPAAAPRVEGPPPS